MELRRRGLRVVGAQEASDPFVARALAAMKREPARRWTVAALGRVAGLSRAAFARRFTAVVGDSPLRWLADYRVRLAQARLLESDVPLVAIAGEVGYASEFAFAKAFKRIIGIAPGHFRRRGRMQPLAMASFRAAA